MWGALIPAAAQVAGAALGGAEPGGGPNVSGAPVTFAPSYGRSAMNDPATLAVIVVIGLLVLYEIRKAK